ncbi:MAG: ATP-binding cassette domain-containing protein [Pseudomonadota bacterium]
MPERGSDPGAGEARILRFPARARPEAPAAPPPTPVLEDIRLHRGGRRVLDGLTLHLPGAGVTALIGPNGAGKSLTLRVLAGLVAPQTGAVRADPSAAALVFQRPVLLRRRARADLDHALRAARVPRADRAARLEALLNLGGLEGLADRPARSLSGGEAQRFAFIRALAARPRRLLLDEPTASLDPRATAALEDLIARTAAEGVEIVLVTHDRGQAARLADRVAFVHAGRTAEETPADRFFARPASEAAQAYLDGRLLL